MLLFLQCFYKYLVHQNYEDNLSGKIDDEKFAKISKVYTDEQTETVQIITIYWNCIGAIEIHDMPKIPDVDVTVNTRKGINVK